MSTWKLCAMLASIIVALCAPRANASTPESNYDRALAAYQASDYAQAKELWLAALREQGADAPDRATVLYDIGNAAFRQKKPLEAAGWYSASLRLAPRNEDAWHNLELVRREAGLDPADRGDLQATTRRLLTMLTLPESERVALGLGALLALALLWEAVRGGSAAKITSAVLAVLLLIALAPWTYHVLHGDQALVFVAQPEGAALHSEPRAQSAVIGRIGAASEVERVDQLPGWVRVRDGNSVGWIANEAAIPLSAPYDTTPAGS